MALQDKSFNELCEEMKQSIDRMQKSFYNEHGTDDVALYHELNNAKDIFDSIETHAHLTAY